MNHGCFNPRVSALPCSAHLPRCQARGLADELGLTPTHCAMPQPGLQCDRGHGIPPLPTWDAPGEGWLCFSLPAVGDCVSLQGYFCLSRKS